MWVAPSSQLNGFPECCQISFSNSVTLCMKNFMANHTKHKSINTNVNNNNTKPCLGRHPEMQSQANETKASLNVRNYSVASQIPKTSAKSPLANVFYFVGIWNYVQRRAL